MKTHRIVSTVRRLSRATGMASAVSLAAMALAPQAAATQYSTVVPESSEVRFHYQQMGVGMDGEFTRFTGELDFDTEQPEAASASFAVDLSSVDTGTTDGDEEIVRPDWFDVDNHPKATFVSETIKVVGDGELEVTGTLTIKGTEQTVTLPAAFSATGDAAVFEGEFTLRRGDFNIGEGSWSTFDIVANDVTVTVKITAKAD